MYTEHPVFNPPPDDAVLWRYMDFTKFVSLLDRSALFFARADKLGDPFEGAPSNINTPLISKLPPDEDEKSSLALRLLQRDMRRLTYISCWHENSNQSAAMWSLYSSETNGIAIKTDFDSFKKSLPFGRSIYGGRVSYVDDENYLIPKGNTPDDDTYIPFLHKRQSFSHEREVRAIVRIIPFENGKPNTFRDIGDSGRYFDVDLSLLIQEVIVAPLAPDWLFELIQSVANRYNVRAPVNKSTLADDPVWF